MKQQQNKHQVAVRKKQRPWLLLWLLPYLVFSFASESWHSHAPGHRNAPSTLTAACVEDADPQGEYAALLAAPQAEAKTECLACQWLGNSTAFLAGPVSLPVPATPALSPPYLAGALPARSPSHFSIRGPPLS